MSSFSLAFKCVMGLSNVFQYLLFYTKKKRLRVYYTKQKKRTSGPLLKGTVSGDFSSFFQKVPIKSSQNPIKFYIKSYQIPSNTIKSHQILSNPIVALPLSDSAQCQTAESQLFCKYLHDNEIILQNHFCLLSKVGSIHERKQIPQKIFKTVSLNLQTFLDDVILHNKW